LQTLNHHLRLHASCIMASPFCYVLFLSIWVAILSDESQTTSGCLSPIEPECTLIVSPPVYLFFSSFMITYARGGCLLVDV
jgi:hypothetical protein